METLTVDRREDGSTGPKLPTPSKFPLMELYDLSSRSKLPLWKHYDQAEKGVGLKGVSLPTAER